MKISISLKICAGTLFLCVFFPEAMNASAASRPSYVTSRYETYQPRKEVVGQALDAYEQKETSLPAVAVEPVEALSDVHSSIRETAPDPVVSAQPQAVTVARISDPEFSQPGEDAPIRDPKKTIAQQFFDLKDPNNSLDIGFEAFDYSYREEGFMKIDGTMYGLRSEYEHRFRKPYQVTSMEEMGKTVIHPTMFKVDARVSGMWDGHYRSEGTGDAFDEKHYSYEVRTMAGYDYYLKNGFTVTPYIGVGYRYLLDDNGGKRSTTGHWAYDRESQYYYVPIGFDLARPLSERWRLKWNAEYDWFMTGQQKSHFEDDPDGVYTQTLSNHQPSGYGARTSLKLSRQAEMMDLFLEPFVRYWHIEPSHVGCSDETCGIEPNNRTEEYGLRMGVNF